MKVIKSKDRLRILMPRLILTLTTPEMIQIPYSDITMHTDMNFPASLPSSLKTTSVQSKLRSVIALGLVVMKTRFCAWLISCNGAIFY